MRRKTIKRAGAALTGLLLCALLLAGPLTGTARAEDGGLLRAGDLIWFGSYTDDSRYYGEPLSFPISWVVLDPAATNAGEEGAFLLSQYVVQQAGVRFDNDLAVWQGSLAQQWCADFAQKAFTEAERAMILEVSKHEEQLENYALNWAENDLDREQVFFLSAREAKDYIGPEGSDGLTAETPDGIATYWWFRSASFIHPDWSGLVLQDNDIHDSQVWETWGARPAMNLELKRAVLLLPAQGQREPGRIAAPERPEDGAWKLAIADASRRLTVTWAEREGDTLRFGYEDAPTGEGEYLSLLLRTGTGEPLAWGRLCRTEQSAGTCEASLSGLALPEDVRVCVFAEHEGGDYLTNTTSPLCDLTLLLEDAQAGAEAESAAQAEAEGSAEARPDGSAQAPADGQSRSPLLWIVPAALAVLLLPVLLVIRRRR